jgi:hypothetical protein
MINLINRVRGLSDAPSTYTDSSTPYWSDDDIQNILDSNATFVIDDLLTDRPQTIGGGTVNYLVYQSHYRDLEEAASGTARWIVRDGNGADAGTANYTTNYRQGQITFSSDQAGTAYYLTGYSYDVHAAAADLWLERLANFADWYKFSADNQTFDRQQAFDHAMKMEQRQRQLTGKNVVLQAAGDLRHSEFVRVDIR